MSQPLHITIGVPQWSILGLLLDEIHPNLVCMTMTEHYMHIVTLIKWQWGE